MKSQRPWTRRSFTVWTALAAVGLVGCQSFPRRTSLLREPAALAVALAALPGAPSDLSADAPAIQAFAQEAFAEGLRLRDVYGVGFSPIWHNRQVNLGDKERGLCHHWAQDLFDALCPLAPEGLHFQFIRANPGRFSEHTAFVVGWAATPWESRIVIDGWRHGGELVAVPIAADTWPWELYAPDSPYSPVCSVAWQPMWPV